MGDRLPRRAVNTVQAYVMRLRRLLGDGVITTRGRGYQLAAAQLAKALALWRGPVFADVPPSPSLAVRVAQLEQVRLAAEDDHVAALIDLDQHAKVVHQLYRLVEEDPLRERRWMLLMRTLDRCGRRAEALDTYHRARRLLRDELGLEPGAQLRELQRAILTSGASGAEGHPAWLDAMRAAGEGEATAVVISATDGQAGTGEATVAVHWPHRLRDRRTARPDTRALVTLDARVLRSQLRPTRAAGLQESRAFAVNDSAAALRRIERDLHDGAQAQLVTLAMKLGLAKDEPTAGDTAPPSPWSTPRMSAPSRPSSSLPRLK